jgi:large subunit ribosomal protein L28
LRYLYAHDTMVFTNLPYMAKICPVMKIGSRMGGGYSNRTRATQFNPTGKVRKYPNLQKKKIFIPEMNKHIILTLSTKAIKTINKKGAYATLKKAGVL